MDYRNETPIMKNVICSSEKSCLNTGNKLCVITQKNMCEKTCVA